MDCPICLNIITSSYVGSCSHHFCKKCLINWCKYGGTECPVCKTYIYEIKSDLEFDYINSENISNSSDISDISRIIIKFKENDIAGIT